MIAEHDIEAVRGLPGVLPKGETLLWQGSPDWRRLARSALHTHLVAIYFGILLTWAVIDSLVPGGVASPAGIVTTAVLGALAYGILNLLAWLIARSTVYSITSKRVVMRVGVALSKCVNLPFSAIADAHLAENADGTGDIALALNAKSLGWLVMWPHIRPWRLARPEPTLRAIPDAAKIARLLAEACAAAVPGGRRVATASDGAAEGFGEAIPA